MLNTFHCRTVCILILSLSIFSWPALSQEAPTRPPRIAIGEFEYKGVMHLEDGTAPLVDMISTALIKTRKFKLVERNRVNEALKEMGLGEAGIVDPEDCQRFGTLVKADFILFGTITQASLDEKEISVSGLNTESQTMRMSVDIRIIDAETGEIKSAETITKTKVASKEVHVAGGISTEKESSGIVSDVLRDVANGIIEKLVSDIYPITIEAVRENGQVKLNYGAPMIEPNTVYNVYDAEGFKAGEIVTTDVQSRSSLAVKKTGHVAVGMTCKRSPIKSGSKVKVQEIPW